MKISVASIPYFWSKDAYYEFYHNLAETNVDIVYLGETVCSKRRSMKLNDWLILAELLEQSGKQAVLSSLILLEAESEVKYLNKICAQKNFLIEANDMSAVQLASQCNNEFVVGNTINIYNNQSLQYMAELGMSRWCVPVELGKTEIQSMLEKLKSLQIEIEYQVFGRLPLAVSARCFTARHHQLPKDNCQFKCLEDEQGILLETQEGDSFAQINGIQIQSAKVTNLVSRWNELADMGVDIARIVPLSAEDTLEVIEHIETMISNQNTTQGVDDLFNGKYEFCNGYWLQVEGMNYSL